jgi:hypothetical protein
MGIRWGSDVCDFIAVEDGYVRREVCTAISDFLSGLYTSVQFTAERYAVERWMHLTYLIEYIVRRGRVTNSSVALHE